MFKLFVIFTLFYIIFKLHGMHLMYRRYDGLYLCYESKSFNPIYKEWVVKTECVYLWKYKRDENPY